MLVRKIDSDGDNKVTEHELQEWVQGVQERFIQKDVERQWLEFSDDADASLLTFEQFKKKQYGDDFDGACSHILF